MLYASKYSLIDVFILNQTIQNIEWLTKYVYLSYSSIPTKYWILFVG